MSKKVWLVKWYKPSKVFKNEKVGDFAMYPTEAQAQELVQKLKATKDITDITVQETECCSM